MPIRRTSCTNTLQKKPADGFECHHLDEIRDERQKKLLFDRLIKLPPETKNAVLIFASPQVLHNETWKDLVFRLDANNLLRMVHLDEVHLFLDHGSDFRAEIPNLKPCLFDTLRVDESRTTLKALVLAKQDGAPCQPKILEGNQFCVATSVACKT